MHVHQCRTCGLGNRFRRPIPGSSGLLHSPQAHCSKGVRVIAKLAGVLWNQLEQGLRRVEGQVLQYKVEGQVLQYNIKGLRVKGLSQRVEGQG